jgi:hypothetical protein
VGLLPRRAADADVYAMHMWVMNPATITVSFPASSTS